MGSGVGCVHGRGAWRKTNSWQAPPNPTTSAFITLILMKMKTLLTFALTLALGGSFAFAAEEDTPLMKEMKTVNKNLRTLKRQVDDPAKKDENLALIAASKKAIEETTKMEPAKTKEVPAGEKAAYLDKYKAQMNDLAKTYADLETAVKDGKTNEAKKLFEKLSEQKEKGHKDFHPDE